MKFFFYFLGGFLFILLWILRDVVIFQRSITLNNPELINYASLAFVAIIAFAIADFIANRSS